MTSLDAYFRERAAADAFSGAVRVTRGEDERFAGAYGWASRAWRVPNTIDTRFDTASITKLFTAVSTLQQVDAGAFTLDESVTSYLGLEGTRISPTVTARHLLTHSSGIADDADEEAGEDYADLFRDKPNYSIRETADFLPQFVHKEPNFAPGEGCRYNNVGYVLLGLMIERATGRSYREVVAADVFARAGMTGAGFPSMDIVSEGVAEGADPIRDAGRAITGWRRNIYSYPPIGSPDGGAVVTVRDLHRLIRGIVDGALLSPASTALMLRPHVDYRVRDDHTIRWGMGAWFHVEAGGEVLFFEKEGLNAGTSGFVRHYPSRDITVALLSNTEDGAWEPQKRLHEAVMAGAFGRA
jgi:CubicO group peptidase (beta-lactamase class C family)